MVKIKKVSDKMITINKNIQSEILMTTMEEIVPQDSLFRKIDKYIDFTFIYDKVKVLPYKEFKSYNFDNLKMRYIVQCFELKDDKAKVILAMNHFKAKTSGIDKNDGQGGSADRRVMEARECLKVSNGLCRARRSPAQGTRYRPWQTAPAAPAQPDGGNKQTYKRPLYSMEE